MYLAQTMPMSTKHISSYFLFSISSLCPELLRTFHFIAVDGVQMKLITLNPWLEVEVNTRTTFVAYVRTCLLHFKLWVSPQVLVTELIEKTYGRFVRHVH